MGCTIQISNEVINGGHEMFSSLDCFVCLWHVNTDPNFSRFLGDNDNRTNLARVLALQPFQRCLISQVSRALFLHLLKHGKEFGDGAVVGVSHQGQCEV